MNNIILSFAGQSEKQLQIKWLIVKQLQLLQDPIVQP